jgi:hypothetical protein
VFAVVVKISILPKSFLLPLINNAMRITEIIQPEYEEQPVATELSGRRQFREFRKISFKGTEQEWRDRVLEIVPNGGNFYKLSDDTVNFFYDDRKIADWSPRDGGKGTIPRPTPTIGRGAYAAVQQTDDPFVVRKKSAVSTLSDSPDAYMSYVNTIRQYMKQNPFFPRVYRVKVQTSGITQRPSYDTERLHPYTVLDHTVLTEMALRYFPELERELANTKNADTIWDILSKEVERTARDIGRYLRATQFRSLSISDITDLKKMQELIPEFVSKMQNQLPTFDPQLVEALTLIACVTATNPIRYNLDMHSGNSMIRLTSAGPQLVFTDPIA